MKYFLPEIWYDFQDNEKIKDTEKKWDENVKMYYEQLAMMEERLSEKNYNFFKNENLHDGRLVSLRIVDQNYQKMKETNFSPVTRKKKPVGIDLEVIADSTYYVLCYRNTATIDVKFAIDAEGFSDYFKSFGDWGYDELTKKDDYILMHEILFSTGATIKIEFEKFSFTKKKIKWQK